MVNISLIVWLIWLVKLIWSDTAETDSGPGESVSYWSPLPPSPGVWWCFIFNDFEMWPTDITFLDELDHFSKTIKDIKMLMAVTWLEFAIVPCLASQWIPSFKVNIYSVVCIYFLNNDWSLRGRFEYTFCCLKVKWVVMCHLDNLLLYAVLLKLNAI